MANPTNRIKISVVIPALNEERYLPNCIQSLKSQNFEHPYEIIVVNNNSTDRTAEVASDMGATVVLEPHIGITWARQKGLETAQGEIVACVDADTVVPKDWLQQIYHTLGDDDEIVGASGKIFYTKGDTWKGKLPALLGSVILYSDMAFRYLFGKPGTLWGGNFAVRKRAVIKAGGFNKKIKFFGEDTELSLRLGKIGKIKFNKKQLAYTSPRRFESQPLLKTFWSLIANFVWLVMFERDFESRKRLKFPLLKKSFRVALYTGSILIVPIALVFYAFNPASQIYGKVYSAGFDRKEKVIALTFDDGPDEPYTSEVLKILDDYHIKATFFVIGKNAEYYPSTVKEIIKHGHIIGNHSYSHSYRLPFESKNKIQEDVLKTENIIYRLTGRKTGLYRPPHGLRTPWFLKDVQGMHYSIITWNDMTDDYDSAEDSEEIAQAIIKKACADGIIDLHDGKDSSHGINRSNTVKALPLILTQLKKEGYSFVTLPDLLQISAYK